MVAELIPAGGVGLHIVKRGAWVPDDLAAKISQWTPKSDLGRIVWACFAHLPADLAADLLDRITSTLVIESSLALVHNRFDHHLGRFVQDDYGVVSRKVITTAGVNYLTGCFNNATNNIALFKYHGIGTGSTAEAIGDTALVTELTTEYNPNSTRATGSQANSTNTYTTVGTNTLDSGTPALREHGVFSASSAGTLWDRTLFASITLDGTAGDGLQSTYTLTCSAGG
jgi:hypothetical protein